MRRGGQKGSILLYILIAIFLTGILVLSVTGGPQKSALTGELDTLVGTAESDIATAASAINDCALQYATPVDRDGDGKTCPNDTDGDCAGVSVIDNPNPLFPLYGTAADNTVHGSAGADLGDIVCPGAPGQGKVFAGQQGRDLHLLGAAPYTVKYFNDSTEGVLLRVTRSASSPLWTEAIARLNEKFSACKAAAVTAADGTCNNGCFYFWILRRTDTTSIGTTGAESSCAP